MARHYFRILVLGVAASVLLAGNAVAEGPPSGPVVRVSSSRVRPGDALLVTVEGVPSSVAPSMSGTAVSTPSRPPGKKGALPEPTTLRALRFYPTATGVQAIVALPIELEPGILAIEIPVASAGSSGTGRSGAPSPLLARVEIVDPGFPETKLSVAPKFIAPTPEQKRRMEEDQAAFQKAFARPFEAPLFDGAFAQPREARITGQYGERRTFNGEKKSQHYGVDLAGAEGEPVRATNDGVVALVRDAFASGKSVVVAHGGGLFSVYFHLSEFEVQTGDRVRRGQVIAKVGATGRVTGPHLHFGVKANDLYVDPDSVYRLPFTASR